jgi:hypothetical protein
MFDLSWFVWIVDLMAVNHLSVKGIGMRASAKASTIDLNLNL